MNEVPRCVLAGAMCTGTAARCEGNTLIRCESGYARESRTDCAVAYEGTCQSYAMGARCVPTATMCDVRGEEFCNRTALGVCVNGRYRSFECTSIGVAACVIDTMRNWSCRN